MASAPKGTLYIGVTSNLSQRATQHRHSLIPGVTAKYSRQTRVHLEIHPDMPTAIAQEKHLKAGSRYRKRTPIERTNPTWRHLHEDIIRSDKRTKKPQRLTTTAAPHHHVNTTPHRHDAPRPRQSNPAPPSHKRAAQTPSPRACLAVTTHYPDRK